MQDGVEVATLDSGSETSMDHKYDVNVHDNFKGIMNLSKF